MLFACSVTYLFILTADERRSFSSFLALTRGSALCRRVTRHLGRSRRHFVCPSGVRSRSFSLPVPSKVSTNTEATDRNLDTDQRVLINRIPSTVCCHEVMNCAVSHQWSGSPLLYSGTTEGCDDCGSIHLELVYQVTILVLFRNLFWELLEKKPQCKEKKR